MEAEIHIAGLLVQSLPERVEEAANAIAMLDQAEIHGQEAGRLIVVSECASAKETLDLIDRLRALPGVVNVALVYQHAESAAAMNEEMDHETDAPGVR